MKWMKSPEVFYKYKCGRELLKASYDPVSYTHLDVYKRQFLNSRGTTFFEAHIKKLCRQPGCLLQ